MINLLTHYFQGLTKWQEDTDDLAAGVKVLGALEQTANGVRECFTYLPAVPHPCMHVAAFTHA